MIFLCLLHPETRNVVLILKCYESLLEEYSDFHAFQKRGSLIKLWRYVTSLTMPFYLFDRVGHIQMSDQISR